MSTEVSISRARAKIITAADCHLPPQCYEALFYYFQGDINSIRSGGRDPAESLKGLFVECSARIPPEKRGLLEQLAKIAGLEHDSITEKP